MATVHLDERRVVRLTPRKSTYDVRDRDLKGFGVRVLPSGAKRYFIHSQYQGRRVWKIVGDAGAIDALQRGQAANGEWNVGGLQADQAGRRGAAIVLSLLAALAILAT